MSRSSFIEFVFVNNGSPSSEVHIKEFSLFGTMMNYYVCTSDNWSDFVFETILSEYV